MSDGSDAQREEQLAGIRLQRSLAKALGRVAAAFSVGVLCVMLWAHAHDAKDEITDSPDIRELKEQLRSSPDETDNVAAAIREKDLELRESYFSARRLLYSGSILLLVGVAGCVLCLKWYASLKGIVPNVERRSADLAEQDANTRSRGVLALCVTGAAVCVALLVMCVLGETRLSPLQPARGAEKPKPVTDGKGQKAPRPSHGFKDNWPQFRGPTGMGLVKDGDWPRKWNGAAGENIVWKCAVPAKGHSSPVIWGDRIFLTGGDKEKRQVLCIDRTDGKLRWASAVKSSFGQKAKDEEESLELYEDTGYAAPTPTTDGERVYAMFATAELAGFDFDGKQVWARYFGRPQNMYGIASSLIMCDEQLILQFDQGSSPDDGLSALLALDPKTGETLWQTDRPVPNSWTTPLVVRQGKAIEIVTSADSWVISYDPALGSELWRAEGVTGDVAPTPVYAGDLVYVAQAYDKLLAIRLGGEGDVTKTHIVWKAEEGMPDTGSPVCNDKWLLQAQSNGQVTCYDAKKGTLLWEQYFDSNFQASPILAGKLVYLFADDGKAFIFELGGKYELLSTADIGEKVTASPAFGDSRVYIRGIKHLFCVGKD